MDALDRLLTRVGPPADLAVIIEREAQAASEPDKQADLWFRLGDLRRELGDSDGAFVALREALEHRPRHVGARASIEKLLVTDRAAAVLDLLEPLYEADGDHQKRVMLAEVRLGFTRDPTQRAAELMRIAQILQIDGAHGAGRGSMPFCAA